MRWSAVIIEVIRDIKQCDNNIGVRLPAAIAREAQGHAGQRVRLTVSVGQIIITPAQLVCKD